MADQNNNLIPGGQVWLQIVPAGSQLHFESNWLGFGVSLTRNRVDSQLALFGVEFGSAEIRMQ